eukprot:jgi/Chrzof1/13471/UNPLg00556.t1
MNSKSNPLFKTIQIDLYDPLRIQHESLPHTAWSGGSTLFAAATPPPFQASMLMKIKANQFMSPHVTHRGR